MLNGNRNTQARGVNTTRIALNNSYEAVTYKNELVPPYSFNAEEDNPGPSADFRRAHEIIIVLARKQRVTSSGRYFCFNMTLNILVNKLR